ncbi:MAG: NAD(P)-dependent oxidoreductase [Candidatus Pacebacteria bacterium]|nr:NAD(P)-dependent oxidoreductase [Candidatus Paceibacterota bacterium]
MKKIALLGATGYIGKSLLYEFVQGGNVRLFLFSRSKKNLESVMNLVFKNVISNTCEISIHTLEEFNAYTYDAIINCTGIGDQAILKNDVSKIFEVTESVDKMIIAYITKKINTKYINMSSGAVYGNSFTKPVTEKTKIVFNDKKFSAYEYYAIAKINSEAKHRALNNLHIIDIRIFAFFSHFFDSDASFFMSQVASCIKNKKVFETSDSDMVRDYVSTKDLYYFIKLCIDDRDHNNDFFDIYSKKPISKFEILSYLHENFGLRYTFYKSEKTKDISFKNIYYSKNKKAKNIGYEPEFSSIESISEELKKILS